MTETWRIGVREELWGSDALAANPRVSVVHEAQERSPHRDATGKASTVCPRTERHRVAAEPPAEVKDGESQ